ncbi:MAG: bifunctional heptose 7-phosphate kinase/heptose 1-phosphate adenyltransferase [Methylothermaceae bacteria B42]|nr:MAG: bifunctional heptose 7-phosphate kinase/heptose 1-phosphate adenyltransferase [Methylothermaceae bacteria B42]HHJ38954.1 bifunctional D-glycero-beta-D-manno-heptose-7-phosphate kinase/D-glycero-beta-D-manno-heptose 1-phosphate adenylyltransferase HldE [Methylothermaceae bacterium]
MELPDFSRLTLLVAGDLMLDRYWSGSASRISPEAPVPVVHVHQTEARPGGAGNVALNLAALGCRVILIGCRGQDEAGEELETALCQSGIDCRLLQTSSPTIVKLRVLSQHQQLIRLDFEQPAAQGAENQLVGLFNAALEEADGIVLSDYAKGALKGCEALLSMARRQDKPVVVDPKGNDFSRYRGATVLTPNSREFAQIAGHWRSEEEMVAKAATVRKQLDLQALLITRGESGLTLMEAGRPPLHIPADSKEVFDVTGAGDTVAAWLAANLAAEIPLAQAARLANTAAGVAVGKLGAASVMPEEVVSVSDTDALISRSHLFRLVAAAKARGEKIVVTNGCFDILHAGHIQYLRAARQLGDRLVVLLNDDASVRRLKGAGRPINPLSHRAQVLAELACVDWVTAFSEDTPKTLICDLLPDVLVKGGDYPNIQAIAGHDCVLANGGEVKLLPLLEGCSTTKIIETMADL